MGGTDDDMSWNGSEMDGNVRSKCEGDEGTGYEGFQEVMYIQYSG